MHAWVSFIWRRGAYHLSYRHRNRLLSTEAQALLISAKTPQALREQPIWTLIMRSSTMPGMLLATGDRVLSTGGHCMARSPHLVNVNGQVISVMSDDHWQWVDGGESP